MFNLDKNRATLLVIDVQEKLAASMERGEFERFLAKTKMLIAGAAALGLPIVESLQYKKGLGESWPGLFGDSRGSGGESGANGGAGGVNNGGGGENGGEISRLVFEKVVFSCVFEWSAFSEFLAKNPSRDQIIIAGMEAHICVLQSARDVRNLGLSAIVASDCVISRDVSNKNNALALMANLGVSVANAESVLFDLLKTAKAAEFKAISALVR